MARLRVLPIFQFWFVEQEFLGRPSLRLSNYFRSPFPTSGRAPAAFLLPVGLPDPPAPPLPLRQPPPTLGCRLGGGGTAPGVGPGPQPRGALRAPPLHVAEPGGSDLGGSPTAGGRVGAAGGGRRCAALGGHPLALGRELQTRPAPAGGRAWPGPSRPRRRHHRCPGDGSAHRPVPLSARPIPPAPPPAPGPTLLVRSSSGSPLSASPSSLQSESKPPWSRAAAAAALAAPGELGSGANIEAGTGESIGERLRSAAIFNNLS